jgi:hypothetical protein
MNEFLIKYRVSTDWHDPHNMTTHNDYTEIVSAQNGKEALAKVLPSFSNPNKTVEILAVQKL